MKVLVLGGTGYIGTRLGAKLRDTGWATPVSASSRGAAGAGRLRLDTRDAAGLTEALRGMDAVVNCVAGNAAAIEQGAAVLAQASLAAGCPRIVHLSSMAVYGRLEARVREEAPLDPSLGWYARAKCESERHISSFVRAGGTAAILRPGCVWGPGSELWVGRIARLLRAGRLGDLGAAGDGWTNLVHLDDVCSAVIASLRSHQSAGQVRTYNLSAPDSPRWNEYFVNLALAIGATPVRRLAPLQLRLDAWLAGPPLKLAGSALAKTGRFAHALPDPLPPGLLGLWERHLQLDCEAAQQDLGIRWMPYAEALEQSAAWYLREERGSRARAVAVLGKDLTN